VTGSDHEWVTLERALPLPTLMLVTDRWLAGGEHELLWMIEQAVGGGVNVVQLREKDLAEDDLVDLADQVRDVVDERAILLVNTSCRAALEAGADGIHFPEGVRFDRPADEMIAGRSVHSVAAAVKAKAAGADYVIAGPIYDTTSHPDQTPAGVQLISDIDEAVSIPIIAIGGIREERIPEVMEAGASGVAVVSAIIESDDPLSTARRLRTTIDRYSPGKAGWD
jgi:thiamine-phosphate pyrophosphorylase